MRQNDRAASAARSARKLRSEGCAGTGGRDGGLHRTTGLYCPIPAHRAAQEAEEDSRIKRIEQTPEWKRSPKGNWSVTELRSRQIARKVGYDSDDPEFAKYQNRRLAQELGYDETSSEWPRYKSANRDSLIELFLSWNT